jgi:hypothetical protein
MPFQVQEASRTPNRLEQYRITPQHIIIQTTSTDTRERILKAVRQKKQIPYKDKPIKITIDFSMEIFKGRIACSEDFQALNKSNFNPRYSTQKNYHSE